MLINIRCNALSKKTFEIAELTGKAVIIQLKDNQSNLKNNCEDIILFEMPVESYKKVGEKAHNRIEEREINVYHNLTMIEDSFWLKYIKILITVLRTTLVFDTKTKNYKDRTELSFYICNQMINAKDCYEYIRNHWLIENCNHYVRDVSLLEDDSRIRVNPMNMAILRSFSLNILRKNKVENIKGTLYDNSLQFNDLYSYQQFI